MAKAKNEEVMEQEPATPEARATTKKATSTEYTLKPGEVYLELKGTEDYLITTRANWDSIYSKSDKWELKDEKKR